MGEVNVGRVIEEAKKGKEEFVVLRASLREKDDQREVRLIESSGERSSPPKESTTLVLSLGDRTAVTLAVDDGVSFELKEGEKVLYSSSEKEIKGSVHLKNDGTVEVQQALIVGKNKEPVVLYGPLKEFLDQFVAATSSAFGKLSGYESAARLAWAAKEATFKPLVEIASKKN